MSLNKQEEPFFSNKKKNKVSRAPSRLPPAETFNNSIIKMKR